MKTLHVSVANKIATYQKRDGEIVCGNSDYQIEFSFDSEWGAYTQKVARFKYATKHTDVPFTGNICPVPTMRNVTSLSVGVYAGELCTTTPATIGCIESILCGDSTPAEPGIPSVNNILPIVTEADNNKVLMVVDGTWQAAEPPTIAPAIYNGKLEFI